MRRTTLLLFSLVMLCLSTSAHAQLWSGILDPTRAIDWSTAGIPGGIPNRTTICSSIAASTYGNGSSDATAGIQAALNSCPANQVVLLSAGTFRINSSLTIPSNKVLRGAGPRNTILNINGTSNAAITFGNATQPSSSTSNAITGGATKGSTSITVSGGGISVGQLMVVTQNNLSYMTNAGDGGTCSWCSNEGGNSGQTVRVTGVSGSTITFTPPLYLDYTNVPTVYPFNLGGTNMGLEALQLYGNSPGYSTNILIEGATYSWIYNVESNFSAGSHIWLYYCLGNTIQANFIHDGFSHGPGSTDNELRPGFKASGNLVVNNIFYRQHVSIMPEWGASGNVFAYNYSTGNYVDSSTGWMLADFEFHGAHPMMNLFEGNIGVQFQLDSYWGSSSHTTLYRDLFIGSNQTVPPINARGALQPGNATTQTSHVSAYLMDYLGQYNNMVGTISGSPYLLSVAAIGTRLSPVSGGSSPTCIDVGYDYNGNAHTPNNTDATMFYHGVYDCLLGTFRWNSGTTQTLPPSFFLSSQPSWWSTSWGAPSWPPIGPDVTGGNISGVNGHAYKIPAQLCFENLPKDANGYPIFDATSCYKGSGAAPAPPTGLRVQ